jgi:hypothetical protein
MLISPECLRDSSADAAGTRMAAGRAPLVELRIFSWLSNPYAKSSGWAQVV